MRMRLQCKSTLGCFLHTSFSLPMPVHRKSEPDTQHPPILHHRGECLNGRATQGSLFCEHHGRLHQPGLPVWPTGQCVQAGLLAAVTCDEQGTWQGGSWTAGAKQPGLSSNATVDLNSAHHSIVSSADVLCIEQLVRQERTVQVLATDRQVAKGVRNASAQGSGHSPLCSTSIST